MNLEFCPREPDVLQAAAAGEWAPELQAHAHSCPLCRETLLLAQSLREESPALPLPAPGLLYWKAQLLARSEWLQKADRPIRVFERVAFLLLPLAALLTLLGLSLPPLWYGVLAVVLLVPAVMLVWISRSASEAKPE